jgi:hypothetical protein
MTDETELLRRLIEEEIDYRLRDRPSNRPINSREIARQVSEEVLRRLERYGAQVIRLHALKDDLED